MQQSSTPIIDIHVHSTLKPFGSSKYSDNPANIATNSSSLWFSDYRSRIDMRYEDSLGISRYRQSDFTSLTNGQVKIACVSLYPIEQKFFETKSTILRPFQVKLAQLASMFGKKRIAEVKQSDFNYFDDLVREYTFLTKHSIDPNHSRSYEVIGKVADLSKSSNLHVLVTIEGCHAFCNGNDWQKPGVWDKMDIRVQHVKNWDAAPFFVTFAHHFYNGLCTHAKSLFGRAGSLLDQSFGMREYGFATKDGLPPISAEGYELIKLLLQTANGRRILIDVKHMSIDARKEYYAFLDIYDDPVPVIWSHGAVSIGEKMQIAIDLDIDVAKIYDTDGIIGIEIDQRILGYERNRGGRLGEIVHPAREAHYEASFFWKQIITIAEFAYTRDNTSDPWRCISVGTDYDGVINPLNQFPDANHLTIMYQYLIGYLENYWEQTDALVPKNGDEANDVIYRIMYGNARKFIEKHYI